MAYDVRTFQVLAGPSWVDGDRYDITAVNDSALKNISQQARADGMRRRLQTLLADRFQLKVRQEMRDMQEYALVAAKNGSKLREAVPGVGHGINMSCGAMKGTRAAMSDLALDLSRQLGRPVVDRTDLNARYDFELSYPPDDGCGSKSDNLPDGPSIFPAVQEQLGLKLESIRGPVEMIVIEHAEKPEPN